MHPTSPYVLPSNAMRTIPCTVKSAKMYLNVINRYIRYGCYFHWI